MRYSYHGTIIETPAVGLPYPFIPLDDAAAFVAPEVTEAAAPPAVEETPEASTPAETPGAPSRAASRRDWAAYAETLGIDPGDMTRAQIQAAVAAK